MKTNNYSKEENFIMDYIFLTHKNILNGKFPKSKEKSIKSNYADIIFTTLKETDNILSPKLIICKTCTKYSFTMPVKHKNNSSYFMVYDQQLNEINNLLNSMYFSSGDIMHDLWKFSYELFAEEAVLTENELFFIYSCFNKIALGSFETKLSLANKKRKFFYDIQEKFIICHEISHWLSNLANNKNSQNSINISTNLNQFKTEIQEILVDTYNQLGFLFSFSEYSDIIYEHKKMICEKNIILEECFADAIAYSYVFDYVDKEYKNDSDKKHQALQALFLLLMNLQLLSLHHLSFNDTSFENQVAIRISFFRNYICRFFESEYNHFSNELNEMAEKYDKKIMNPINDIFSEIKKRYEYLDEKINLTENNIPISNLLGFTD